MKGFKKMEEDQQVAEKENIKERASDKSYSLWTAAFGLIYSAAWESIRIFYNRGIGAVILGIVYILLITWVGTVMPTGFFLAIISIAAFFTLIAGVNFWIAISKEKKLEELNKGKREKNKKEAVEYQEILDEIEYINTADVVYPQRYTGEVFIDRPVITTKRKVLTL